LSSHSQRKASVVRVEKGQFSVWTPPSNAALILVMADGTLVVRGMCNLKSQLEEIVGVVSTASLGFLDSMPVYHFIVKLPVNLALVLV
jgi:hypothetical protein